MKKLNRVKTKQLAVFLLILLILSLFAGIIFYLVRRLAVSRYVLQTDGLVDEGSLSEYEKRNTLLFIQKSCLFSYLSIR